MNASLPRRLNRFWRHLVVRCRDVDRRALGLLLVWTLNLLPGSLFHDHPQDVGGDSGNRHPARPHVCSGRFLPASPFASMGAECPNPDDCNNPWHHHHPVPHHDATQCPICSSIVARVARLEAGAWIAPHAVVCITSPAARLPPIAQRHVLALARGPPALQPVG